MLAASTVGIMTAAVVLLLGVLLLAVGVWAVRAQSRMFPKDFDRTG